MKRKDLSWMVLLVVPVAFLLVTLPIAQRRHREANTRALFDQMRETNRKRGATEIERLLSDGADVNALSPLPHETGIPLLHLAIIRGRTDVVKLLLEHNVDINTRNYNGETALMVAAWDGHIDIVRLLLQRGADVNTRRTKLTKVGMKRKTALSGTRDVINSSGAVNTPGHIRIYHMLQTAGAKE